MKDKIRILVAVIVYIGICASGVRYYLPSGGFIVEDIARDPEGNIYAGGKTRTGVYIYRLDAGGVPDALYRCRSEADEIQLFCRYGEDGIYAAQMWYQDGMQYFSVWRKAVEESGFQCIWKRSIAEDVTLTDFQVRDGRLYVTGVDQQTEHILLYIWEAGSDRRVRFEADFIPTTVCWGKEGMYTLSQDNHIYFIAEDGTVQRQELEDVIFFLADGNGLYYQTRDSRDITYLYGNGLGEYTFRDMGDVWNIQYSDKAQNSAVLLSQDDRDRLMLVGQDEDYGREIDCTELAFGERIRNLVFPFLFFTFIYAAFMTGQELFWHLVWKPRRLLYQTTATLAGLSGIWLVATISGIQVHEIETEREQQMFLADTCMTVQAERLLGGAGESVRYEGYKGSAQQEYVEKTFSYSVMKNSDQAFYTREELVCNTADGLIFLFSEEAPFGRRADTFYDKEALGRIRLCISTGENQGFIDKVSGISYAMAVTRIGGEDSQTCLVSRVPLYGIAAYNKTPLAFYITAFAGWLLLMAVVAVFLRLKWRSIGVLAAAMERVSRGEYNIDSRKAPDNEFGLMWTGMERMARNLQMQKYRNDETIAYLNQYAPEHFEYLFGKEKLQDIEVGETVQMAATLGMISVIDKDTLLTGKLQGQYVQYVNQLMELLFSQKESGQAVFLQDGSNLENVKVIFPGEEASALTAVQYSLDCMEELLGQTGDQYDTNPFILLHTDQFRCGLAGGSRQVYPYVTSMEMDTLGSYIGRLKRSGARVVVTGQTWQQVQGQVQGRRIGYVASKGTGHGQKTFWLYEILDACPQMQKLGKLKNREDFERALELYYNDELYMARNAFADIVRECPEDGIAKWYVFACDERMNGGDGNHELFRRQGQI